jgi:hypothetical protein
VEPRSGALQVGVPLPPLVRRNQRLSFALFHDSRTVEASLPVATALPEATAGEKLDLVSTRPWARPWTRSRRPLRPPRKRRRWW